MTIDSHQIENLDSLKASWIAKLEGLERHKNIWGYKFRKDVYNQKIAEIETDIERLRRRDGNKISP